MSLARLINKHKQMFSWIESTLFINDLVHLQLSDSCVRIHCYVINISHHSISYMACMHCILTMVGLGVCLFGGCDVNFCWNVMKNSLRIDCCICEYGSFLLNESDSFCYNWFSLISESASILLEVCWICECVCTI